MLHERVVEMFKLMVAVRPSVWAGIVANQQNLSVRSDMPLAAVELGVSIYQNSPNLGPSALAGVFINRAKQIFELVDINYNEPQLR